MSRSAPLILLAITACAAGPPGTGPEIGRAQRAAVNGCEAPEFYGAQPDDGLDDREAVQRAITEALKPGGVRCVELAGGARYDIARDNSRCTVLDPDGCWGTTYNSSLKVVGGRVDWNCNGATLAMIGSGIKPGLAAPSGWNLIQYSGGASGTMRNCNLDGADRFNTEEQTHLVELMGPVTDFRAEGGVWTLPQLYGPDWADPARPAGSPVPSSGGDCIRLLGVKGAAVQDTYLHRVEGHCDRSFIGLQRGVEGLTIDSCVGSAQDQVLDMEATSAAGYTCPGEHVISDVLVINSHFYRPNPQGWPSVSIGGWGCTTSENVVIQNTTIDDGGIELRDSGRTVLRDMYISHRPGATTPPIYASQRVGLLKIENSTVERKADAGNADAVIYVTHGSSGQIPQDVVLDGVTVIQHSAATAISLVSLERFKMLNSKVINAGTATDRPAVRARGIAGPVGAPVLVDVALVGTFAGAASIDGLKADPADEPVLVRVAPASP